MIALRIVGIILGIALIVGGANLALNPVETFYGVMPDILGAIMLVFGIVHFITWIRIKKEGESDGWTFWSAILSIVAGILILFSDDLTNSLLHIELASFIRILVSSWILAEGILTIIKAFDLRKLNELVSVFSFSIQWGWVLVVGILEVIVGLLAIFNPFEAATVLGIMVGMDVIFGGLALIFMSAISQKKAVKK